MSNRTTWEWIGNAALGPKDESLDVDADGDVCIEHEVREGDFNQLFTERLYVPLEVLAELLRRNGYSVVKN